MFKFRVVDLKAEGTAQTEVSAHTPEAAARRVLGVNLVRSGSPGRIRARVYYQDNGEAPKMVRLYERAPD